MNVLHFIVFSSEHSSWKPHFQHFIKRKESIKKLNFRNEKAMQNKAKKWEYETSIVKTKKNLVWERKRERARNEKREKWSAYTKKAKHCLIFIVLHIWIGIHCSCGIRYMKRNTNHTIPYYTIQNTDTTDSSNNNNSKNVDDDDEKEEEEVEE